MKKFKSQPLRTMSVITQWHDIDSRPHNNGVYQCLRFSGQVVWARWVNGNWYCGYDTTWKSSFKFASKSRDTSFISTSYTHWRGITYV